MTQKSSFRPLLFTIFNDAIGWGIVLTIFAPLLFDRSQPILPADTSDGARNLIVGFLIGSYAITQFVSMPVIGALSDHFGRKRILEWTILGAMMSFILSALAVLWASIVLLFVARLLAGFFSANSATASASIADMSSEKEKAKNLSLTGVVGGISWIVGPPLGGFLSTKEWVSWFSFSTPFWFLAVLFLINLFWVNRSYVETYQKKEKHDWKQEIKDLTKLSQIPRMKEWLSVSFLFYFGWFFFILYYPTLFVQKFAFTQQQIGIFSAYLSVFWFLGATAMNQWFAKKINAELSMIWCPLVIGCLVILGTWEGNVRGWIWTFPLLGLGATTCWVNVMTLISNCAGKENQGKAFGILQSSMSLAVFIAPLITGVIAGETINLPMYIGATLLIGVGVVVFALRSLTQKA